jgi:plasmid stability protein
MQIQIPDELGAWLQAAAAKAGMSLEALAAEALRESLEDREDYAIAVAASRGAKPHISLEALILKYGLDSQPRQESGKIVRKASANRSTPDHSLSGLASRAPARAAHSGKSA